jgi:hypothetical protein
MTAGAMTCCKMKQVDPIRLIVRKALDLCNQVVAGGMAMRGADADALFRFKPVWAARESCSAIISGELGGGTSARQNPPLHGPH